MENGAIPIPGGGPQSPAMRFDNRATDGKPHTESISFRGEIWIEHPIYIFRQYATSVVVDGYFHGPVARRRRSDRNAL